jgi:hypothetical protein
MLIIPTFINLHNKNVHSIQDLNQSTVSVMDPVSIAYLKLICESSEKTSQYLN